MLHTDVLPLLLIYFKNKNNFLSKMIETENNEIGSLFDQICPRINCKEFVIFER